MDGVVQRHHRQGGQSAAGAGGITRQGEDRVVADHSGPFAAEIEIADRPAEIHIAEGRQGGIGEERTLGKHQRWLGRKRRQRVGVAQHFQGRFHRSQQHPHRFIKGVDVVDQADIGGLEDQIALQQLRQLRRREGGRKHRLAIEAIGAPNRDQLGEAAAAEISDRGHGREILAAAAPGGGK